MSYTDFTREEPYEPSPEACSAEDSVGLPDGRVGTACWYPSMGGYVGKAVAVVDIDGCVDVWVWHDGQLPFADDVPTRRPVLIYHSDPDQFVQFGHLLERLVREAGGQ